MHHTAEGKGLAPDVAQYFSFLQHSFLSAGGVLTFGDFLSFGHDKILIFSLFQTLTHYTH